MSNRGGRGRGRGATARGRGVAAALGAAAAAEDDDDDDDDDDGDDGRPDALRFMFVHECSLSAHMLLVTVLLSRSSSRSQLPWCMCIAHS